MGYKTITSEKAKKTVDSTFQWYYEIGAKTVKKFDSELRKSYRYIQKNPYQFQVQYDSTRVLFLKKFPFGIHYEIHGNIVFIVALFHTSQDSENWTIK